VCQVAALVFVSCAANGQGQVAGVGGYSNGRIRKGERRNLRLATMSVQNSRTLRHKKSKSFGETSSAGLVGRISQSNVAFDV